MTDRWNALRERVEAFSRRVDMDHSIAWQTAEEMAQTFATYIQAPDVCRVQLFAIPDHPSPSLDSYNPVNNVADAVSQTPDDKWSFGMGVNLGTGLPARFSFRWSMLITVRLNEIIVEPGLGNAKFPYLNADGSNNADEISAHMYAALLEFFTASSEQTPSVKFGFRAD